MPFAPVKSDPWQQGKRRSKRRGHLWLPQEWKRLVELAKADYGQKRERRYISRACLELIRELNQRCR